LFSILPHAVNIKLGCLAHVLTTEYAKSAKGFREEGGNGYSVGQASSLVRRSSQYLVDLRVRSMVLCTRL